LGRFGRTFTEGVWNASIIHPNGGLPPSYLAVNRSVSWAYSWADLIRQHVSQLHPKPRYLVFNAGLWRPSGLNNTELMELRQALSDANIIGIFRTTTRALTKKVGPLHFTPSPVMDKVACGLMPVCFNVSATANLTRKHYYDIVHLKPSAMTRMNQELLLLLKELKDMSFDTYATSFDWTPQEMSQPREEYV
jgi:NAD(P)-dependent dehydrogenase (short-subunit alcohol dehydrogenase family)